MVQENNNPIVYGAIVTARRLGEYYKMRSERMNMWLSRPEFSKFYIPGMCPRKYCWCKDMELELDKLLNPKGYYRCTDSKVHSRYSLEKESSYSI